MTMTPFAPGDFVRLPSQPGWGVGQVQSVVGDRITVSFEHAGKQLLRAGAIDLEPVNAPDRLR